MIVIRIKAATGMAMNKNKKTEDDDAEVRLKSQDDEERGEIMAEEAAGGKYGSGKDH